MQVDGSTWTFVDKEDGTYYLKVITDNKNSVEFSAVVNAKNKNINTFYFDIDQYGNVKPGDALTEAFLKIANREVNGYVLKFDGTKIKLVEMY
jgi:hypothetical protein